MNNTGTTGNLLTAHLHRGKMILMFICDCFSDTDNENE